MIWLGVIAVFVICAVLFVAFVRATAVDEPDMGSPDCVISDEERPYLRASMDELRARRGRRNGGEAA